MTIWKSVRALGLCLSGGVLVQCASVFDEPNRVGGYGGFFERVTEDGGREEIISRSYHDETPFTWVLRVDVPREGAQPELGFLQTFPTGESFASPPSVLRSGRNVLRMREDHLVLDGQEYSPIENSVEHKPVPWRENAPAPWLGEGEGYVGLYSREEHDSTGSGWIIVKKFGNDDWGHFLWLLDVSVDDLAVRPRIAGIKVIELGKDGTPNYGQSNIRFVTIGGRKAILQDGEWVYGRREY